MNKTITKEDILRYLVENHDAVLSEYQGKDFLIIHDWKEVNEVFEKWGICLDNIIDWGFSDEYSICDICNQVVHLYPDYYGDTPDCWINYDAGMVICADCIKESPEDYINHLVNKPRKANFILPCSVLGKFGFKKHEKEFSSDYDDPEKVMSKLRERYKQVVFNIVDVGQFEVTYEAWVKN